LDYLANGLRKKVGPLTLVNLTKLLRSFPSVYQLLPIYACVGTTEDKLRKLDELSELGELDMFRVRDGIRFHHELQEAAWKNAANTEYVASGYKLLPVVGTYQPTYLSALITNEGVKPLRTYKGETLLEGDGTVPRLSATPIELSDAKVESFASCPHAGLQNFDPVRTQIRATVEDIDISEFKAIAPEPISLELDDAFSSSETFHARARYASLDPIRASLTNLDTEEKREAEFEIEPGGQAWQRLALPPLAVGTYRIQIDAGENADSISDVFVVLGEGQTN
jgi:hypothetical protein